jgi:hypothetical protein
MQTNFTGLGGETLVPELLFKAAAEINFVFGRMVF